MSSPRKDAVIETKFGRFILGILRVVCNGEDYLAHRLILGEYPNVGAGFCNQIAEIVSANNLNYKDLFYNPLPNGVFKGRALSILNTARSICNIISSWQPDDSLRVRINELNNIILVAFGINELHSWQTEIANIPQDITIEELRDYLQADNTEMVKKQLEAIYERLGINPPNTGLATPKIRIMSYHGAKGLSAKVVFIPGLEEDILPGQKRTPYNGLVLEAAEDVVCINNKGKSCLYSVAFPVSFYSWQQYSTNTIKISSKS